MNYARGSLNHSPACLSALLTLAFFSATQSAARADLVVATNLPPNGSIVGANPISTTGWEAVGLTTGASSVQFSSLEGIFSLERGGPATLGGGIYSNVASAPGTLLSAFDTVIVSGGAVNETFVTRSPFTLQADTQYWFVVNGQGSLTGWGNDSTVPYGTPLTVAPGYQSDGYQYSSDGGSSWASDPYNVTTQISVASVPEPRTHFLGGIVVALFLFSRMRKLAVRY